MLNIQQVKIIVFLERNKLFVVFCLTSLDLIFKFRGDYPLSELAKLSLVISSCLSCGPPVVTGMPLLYSCCNNDELFEFSETASGSHAAPSCTCSCRSSLYLWGKWLTWLLFLYCLLVGMIHASTEKFYRFIAHYLADCDSLFLLFLLKEPRESWCICKVTPYTWIDNVRD